MEQNRIIIADKDPLFRRNLRETLTKAGYIIVGEAEDGMTALKMIRSTDPDVVITGTNISVLSGTELIRIIEEERLCASVLVIEYGEKELVSRNFGEGWAVPVLIKPFDEFQLLSVLEYSSKMFFRMMDLEKEVSRLKSDLETRKVVEKAKGILMRLYGLSEEAAFRRMQQQSMKKRAPMKTIAKAIIMAHEITASEG